MLDVDGDGDGEGDDAGFVSFAGVLSPPFVVAIFLAASESINA